MSTVEIIIMVVGFCIAVFASGGVWWKNIRDMVAFFIASPFMAIGAMLMFLASPYLIYRAYQDEQQRKADEESRKRESEERLAELRRERAARKCAPESTL